MYFKKTVVCGDFTEVKYYHAPSARPKGTPRRKRKDLTTEAMKILNRVNAIIRLTWLLRCNFLGGVHFHLVLTYKEGKNKSCDFLQMKRDMKKFIAVFRKFYFEKFGKEFRYVFSYGVGKHRFKHFHMVCNVLSGEEYELFESVWHSCIEDAGRIHSTRLDKKGYDGEDLSKLAEYLIKNGEEALAFFEEEGKAYHPSRNLKKPDISVEKVTRSSTFKKRIYEPKGYEVLPQCTEEGADMYGFCYFKYVLRKTE